MLVRVPLVAMRDIEFPLRDQGYLDLPRAGPSLEDAATLWISGAIELQENGRPLGDVPGHGDQGLAAVRSVLRLLGPTRSPS